MGEVPLHLSHGEVKGCMYRKGPPQGYRGASVIRKQCPPRTLE